MSEKPWNERIWLQREGMEDMPLDGTTWCEDQINDDDVEYVRADLVAQKDRELEQSRQREAQALAVVARVKEWAARPRTIDAGASLESVIANIETILAALEDLDTILTDAPKVLAVEDMLMYGDIGKSGLCQLRFDGDWGKDETDPDFPVRVIVLGRDESEG